MSQVIILRYLINTELQIFSSKYFKILINPLCAFVSLCSEFKVPQRLLHEYRVHGPCGAIVGPEVGLG